MIHVGIMGLGQIAHRVAKGICYAENAELYAVGSRSLEKAREFQRLYGAQKIYDSYERLLQDPQVEMVYICTPNHLHFEHIQNALRHGKHVLCEKPLVANAEQLKECFQLARIIYAAEQKTQAAGEGRSDWTASVCGGQLFLSNRSFRNEGGSLVLL